MFKKTLIWDFFTTINFDIFIKTISLITYKLPKLRYWKYTDIIEKEFLYYLWILDSKIISFYNWRSAIFHALKIIWVKKDDEIIVSWYTCISVSNAVIQTWAQIIYSDINKKNLWFDINSLKKNINKNTKVIIIQHTFWKAWEIEKILEIAKNNKILVIEDCAHSLWSKINWKKLWTFWDFSIFSTWRDKVISSVTWWFLIINNKDYFWKIKSIKKELKTPWILLTIQNLLYNISAFKAYNLYSLFWLWKIIIYISRKLKIITEILNKEEKNCNYKDFYYKLPNSLAYLTFNELKKVKLYNNHKIKIALYYDKFIDNNIINHIYKINKKEKSNYYKYPILIKTEKLKKELYNYMKKNNVILWYSWSWTNIVPIWSNLNKAKYFSWTCPNSEDISKRILTLPNNLHINFNDVKKIINLLNNFKK